MLAGHAIKARLKQRSRNVTNKEDKKCIVLKIYELSH